MEIKVKKQNKFFPFILTAAVVAFDQLSKALIVFYVPLYNVAASYFGDFLRIIHARNLGIAFSIGRDSPDALRALLFTLLPIIVLIVIVVYYFVSKDITKLQRWCLAGIFGGGIGNLIDRIFRPEGVVDFIDVKFFGLFGMERWPTFNVADSSVVVCGVLLFITLLFQKNQKNPNEEKR